MKTKSSYISAIIAGQRVTINTKHRVLWHVAKLPVLWKAPDETCTPGTALFGFGCNIGKPEDIYRTDSDGTFFDGKLTAKGERQVKGWGGCDGLCLDFGNMLIRKDLFEGLQAWHEKQSLAKA